MGDMNSKLWARREYSTTALGPVELTPVNCDTVGKNELAEVAARLQDEGYTTFVTTMRWKARVFSRRYRSQLFTIPQSVYLPERQSSQ